MWDGVCFGVCIVQASEGYVLGMSTSVSVMKWVLVKLREDDLMGRGDPQVWQSYYDTIHKKNIHAIPYLAFTLEGNGGGPFRKGTGQAKIVRGSADKTMFLEIFESLWMDHRKQQKADAGRSNLGGPEFIGGPELGSGLPTCLKSFRWQNQPIVDCL